MRRKAFTNLDLHWMRCRATLRMRGEGKTFKEIAIVLGLDCREKARQLAAKATRLERLGRLPLPGAPKWN